MGAPPPPGISLSLSLSLSLSSSRDPPRQHTRLTTTLWWLGPRGRGRVLLGAVLLIQWPFVTLLNLAGTLKPPRSAFMISLPDYSSTSDLLRTQCCPGVKSRPLRAMRSSDNNVVFVFLLRRLRSGARMSVGSSPPWGLPFPPLPHLAQDSKGWAGGQAGQEAHPGARGGRLSGGTCTVSLRTPGQTSSLIPRVPTS